MLFSIWLYNGVFETLRRRPLYLIADNYDAAYASLNEALRDSTVNALSSTK